MAKQNGLKKLPEVETDVAISYYANGKLYIAINKDDTVRFYRMEEDPNGDATWIATDIYLSASITKVSL